MTILLHSSFCTQNSPKMLVNINENHVNGNYVTKCFPDRLLTCDNIIICFSFEQLLV